VSWITANRLLLEELIISHGAVLFRGFGIGGIAQFHAVASAVHPTFVEYSEPSTPRSEYQDKVYVSSEYPQDYSIPLHGELSYTYNWPMKALFYCRKAARVGGETPIADAREVYRRIDPEVRRRFLEKRVMYLRNYHENFLVPWQKAFKSTERAEVERYCMANQPMTWEWRSDDHLRTRQIRPAAALHPVTGADVWFNQAHVFHTYSLGRKMHEELAEIFDAGDQPVHALYGDGSEIPIEDLDSVYEAYDLSKKFFPWKEEDVLLADNMTISHGRHAFEGDREIVVCFVEPCPPPTVRGGVAVCTSTAT
jgi:hypothetical protein